MPKTTREVLQSADFRRLVRKRWMVSGVLLALLFLSYIGVVVSYLTPDPAAQAKFEDEKLRTYLGVGAE